MNKTNNYVVDVTDGQRPPCWKTAKTPLTVMTLVQLEQQRSRIGVLFFFNPFTHEWLSDGNTLGLVDGNQSQQVKVCVAVLLVQARRPLGFNLELTPGMGQGSS